MKIETIKPLLPPDVLQDWEQLQAAFLHAQPHGSGADFLAFLHQLHRIDEAVLLKLMGEEDVELTQMTGPLPEGEVIDKVPGRVPESHYRLLTVLGKGAMGLVHLAQDKDLQRKVAYKQLLSDISLTQSTLNRFLSEAQITAQLDHPNVVPIYSMELQADGSLAYSMKLVRGKTFKELLQESRQQYDQQHHLADSHSLEKMLEHFLKVCDALAFAHNKGVIHRDLKPANIMVGEYNEVYVMDWGIAKVIYAPEIPVDEAVQLHDIHHDEPLEERTQLGQVLGTPRYMSPQQAAGKNQQLDSRSDQFALGLILYEIVTLRPAFTAKSAMDLLKKVLKADKEPWEHYAKVPLPFELKAIIDKTTQLKPAHRYRSVTDMAEDIRRFLRGESVLAKPDTPIQKVWRWIRHHQQATLGLLMVLILSAAAVTGTSLYSRQRQLQITHAHEKRLGDFITAVSEQGRHIDNSLLRLQNQLSWFEGALTKVLQYGQPQTQKYYWNTDYSYSQHQPPDLGYASYYGKMVSLQWPVYKRAPGVLPAQVDASLRQLLVLHPYYPTLLLNSLQQDQKGREVHPANAAATQWQSLLREQGTPITWIHVGLANGLYVSYPGKTGFVPEFDPRKTPWYQLATQQPGQQWGNPYVDSQGQGLVLPCAVSMRNAQGQIQGVAAIELTFDFIIQNWMALTQWPSVRQTYLLDTQGRILIRSSDQKRKYGLRFGEESINQALSLPDFPQNELVQAVRAKRSGHLEFKRDGRELLLVYSRMETLGWTFVVEAESSQLFNALAAGL